MPSSLRVSLLFAALASVAAAQNTIQIRGQVEAGQVSTCYYCPTVTNYVIHGSETPIRSSTIDFSTLLGQHVILTGTWGGTASVPVFDAVSAQVTTAQFSLNGNSSIGNTVRFIASAAVGDLVANVIAMNAGILTITPNTTLLLNVAQAAVLDAGIVTSGQFRTDLTIPNNPALVGLHFFGQAVVMPGNGAAMYATSPDAKRVQ